MVRIPTVNAEETFKGAPWGRVNMPGLILSLSSIPARKRGEKTYNTSLMADTNLQ
jgi:hypothetical protein